MNIIHPIRRRPLDRAALDWPALENLVALGNISGAVSLNLATDGGARAFIGTLIGNATLAPQNIPVAGLVVITVVLVQDAAGGRAVTLPANTTLLEGSNGSLNPAANSANIVTLITRDGGATWLATISEGAPRQFDPLYINPLANGAFHTVFDFPVTLNLAAVRQRGTGTLVYARSTDGTTFTNVTGSVTFNANDVLRVTVSGFAGFLAIAIPRTA